MKMIRLVLNEIDPIKELEFYRTESERFKIKTGQPFICGGGTNPPSFWIKRESE